MTPRRLDPETVAARLELLREGIADLASSFEDAARVGAIPTELADALRPSAGMRNVIVHAYQDLDLGMVAAAVPLAIDGYGRYVTQVAAFVRDSSRLS